MNRPGLRIPCGSNVCFTRRNATSLSRAGPQQTARVRSSGAGDFQTTHCPPHFAATACSDADERLGDVVNGRRAVEANEQNAVGRVSQQIGRRKQRRNFCDQIDDPAGTNVALQHQRRRTGQLCAAERREAVRTCARFAEAIVRMFEFRKP